MKSNYGASAVIAFYFLSGWLMSMSYRRFQQKAPETTVKAFFADRFFKLWPSYTLVFLVSLAFFIQTGIFQFDWRRIPLELLIVPNAFTKMIPWNEQHALNIIPPTWSLGVEACFYLTVPALAFLSYRFKIILAYAMILVHLAVMSVSAPIGHFVTCFWPIRESLCTIPVSDYFGMDFPGTIGVVFLIGFIGFERQQGKRTDNHLFIFWGIYAFYFLIAGPLSSTLANWGTYDVAFSIVFLLPLATAGLVITRTASQPVWDRILGELSYPLFLTHFLALYIVEFTTGLAKSDGAMFTPAICLSIVLSFGLAYFQRMVDKQRYKMRGFPKSAPGQAASASDNIQNRSPKSETNA